MFEGFRTVLARTTVLPVRGPAQPDRLIGTRAVQTYPLVGLLLGTVMGLTAWLLQVVQIPSFLSGVLLVGLLTLLTRGIHLKSLGRIIDGLTFTGHAPETRAVLNSPNIGHWGNIAVVLTLLAEIGACGALVSRNGAVLIGALVAVARWATPLMCMAKSSPLPRHGRASLILNTQRPAFAWILIIVGAFLLAVGTATTAAFSGVMPEVAVVVMMLFVVVAARLTVYYRSRCVQHFGYLPIPAVIAQVALWEVSVAVMGVIAMSLAGL